MTTLAERAGRRIGPAGTADAARGRRLLVRSARLFVLAIVIGLPISQVILYATQYWMADFTSYWWAGEIWPASGSPYTLPADLVGDNPIYRYAPWFAVPWIALVHLPQPVVEIGWFALNAAASVLSVVPALRRYGPKAIPVAAFMGGMLLVMAVNGNVQPLMVCALVWSVETRWGPLVIAASASMKAVPILFVIPYAARGEWRKVAMTLALTGVLTAPILLFEYPARTLDPGGTISLWSVSPILWAGIAALLVGAAFVVARRWPRYAWLATAVAVFEALPRLFVYDVTFLLVGLAGDRDHGAVDAAR